MSPKTSGSGGKVRGTGGEWLTPARIIVLPLVVLCGAIFMKRRG